MLAHILYVGWYHCQSELPAVVYTYFPSTADKERESFSYLLEVGHQNVKRGIIFFFGVLWAPHTLYYFVFSFVGFVAIALLVVVVPDIFRQVIRIVSRISDECGRSNEVLFSILWKGSHTHTRCHTEPKNMIEAISECRKCR